MAKRVSVVQQQSSSGRNERFHDNYAGKSMTRTQFVKAIENGDYKHYHVRNIDGIKTPASNPDALLSNNLG